MSWPFISKEMANVGTLEEPDYQWMPKIITIPGRGHGPWQRCGDCRDLKEANPKAQVGFAIMGARRCMKHILRFHKKQGTLTPELEADVKRRDGIHDQMRRGAYA